MPTDELPTCCAGCSTPSSCSPRPRTTGRVLFTHPKVRDVAVIGLPDPTWGEVVVAVLVPAEPGRPPTATELHDFCRARLAPHKTPVRWLRSVELPLTGSGKVRKDRLREQAGHAGLQEI
ncbi:hypothetical protein ACFQ6N_04480 [Kitasatospora sp. NPDC056446]|uniref:AMP-binding enzyme n=1 Tax=Kitasatospora sp. NPDC056446 TaxID=3345819 RepID=UPI0036AEFA42